MSFVLGTAYNAKNKIQAISLLSLPVLRYNFGIINWCQKEMKKLDRKIRKPLPIHGQNQPKADIDHWYVPRKQEET